MQEVIDRSHTARNVDFSAADRGVWLVKVPKYIAEKWSKVQGTCEVGKLQINKARFPGAKPEVMFTLNEELTKPEAEDEVATPTNHKFMLTGITGQSLSILSEAPGANSPINPVTGEAMYDQLSVEGRVIQRAECRPVADAKYIGHKRLAVELSNKPQRQVEHLKGPVNNYKPRYAGNVNPKMAKAKKEEKRSRLDKDKVTDMLFSAFEKHQYYNVKDLVRITDQPITYVKEILKEICNYNMKAPHKNMWELKPEYRHYQTDDS